MTALRSVALLAALAALASAAVGCASAPPRQPPPATGAVSAPSPGPGGRAATEAAARPAPWQLPVGAAPTQRLFRLRYDGPEGDGILRLVLRLASRDRYRLSVNDRLGRALYTVEAVAGSGLLLDHRRERACELGGTIRVEGVPVDPLPLDALPRLLLGRLPVVPASTDPDTEMRVGTPLDVLDGEGRRWTLELAPQGLVSWTLWEGGEPVAWWQETREGSALSDRVRGVQLTWREVLVEPLALPLALVEVPDGFAAGGCGDLLASPPAS